MQKIELGISPCPNDTWIFYALANQRISLPFAIDMVMADVEVLNARARKGDIVATKLSVAAMVDALDEYVLLRAGGALGRGCGPILVAKESVDIHSLAQSTIAIPGNLTTANMLLSLHNVHKGSRIPMVFDEIMPAVQRGEVDAGLVIHEGRFTYGDFGLHKVLDLGKWWEEDTGLPIPLGVIAVRRDAGRALALELEEAIQRSLAYVQQHPDEAGAYIAAHAQEMNPEVIQEHIKTFVTRFSMHLGDDGEKAVQAFLEKAFALRGTPVPDKDCFIR